MFTSEYLYNTQSNIYTLTKANIRIQVQYFFKNQQQQNRQQKTTTTTTQKAILQACGFNTFP